jgi:hypothetical protein
MSPVSYPPPPPQYQPPLRRPGTVTTVAVMSILFGVVCGCGSIYSIFMPSMMQMQRGMMGSMQEQIERDFETERRRTIERLRDERDTATTPEDQQRIDEEIRRNEGRQAPDMQKMTTMMVPPGSEKFYVVSGIVAALINLVFLVSGIGLFPMMEWARKLNIAASVIDIFYTLASTAYNIAVIGPAMGRGMQEMMQEIQKSAPAGTPPPPMPEMGTLMQMMMGVGASVMAFIIIAWLVAAICMLSTRRVKEAFRARAAAK